MSPELTQPIVAPAAARTSIVLVGNPNVGKSVVFNHLTGRYATVANSPGTTVELMRGKVQLGGREFEVVDTPGVNHLVGGSEDERITRELLLRTNPALVVQVGDAKNLRRSLLLTTQLLEAGLPVVVALNMMDESDARGVRIDHEKLSVLLGVPVVPTTATTGAGIAELKQRMEEALSAATAKREQIPTLQTKAGVDYGSAVEESITQIESLLPSSVPAPRRSVATMFLAGDPNFDAHVDDWVGDVEFEKLLGLRADLQKKFPEPLSFVLNQRRLYTVDRLMAATYDVEGGAPRNFKTRLGYWTIRPLSGTAILAVVLYVTFWVVGLFAAGTVVNFFEKVVFHQWLNPLAIQVTDTVLPFPHQRRLENVKWSLEIPLTPVNKVETPIAVNRTVSTSAYEMPKDETLSSGQQVVRFFNDFLVGNYGAVTMALSYGLAIVLPIVTFFFLIFSVLEDTGYLPRLAIMVNRIFKKMGLNGKAVLPMILGLGCDTMATMTARILETKKERLITTILLALAVPCSAQLGVLMAMMAAVSPAHTAIWAVVVLGVMLTVGFLAARVLPGEAQDFVLELPPMRMPQLRNVAIKTGARVKWYLKEVIPLFVLGTAILFVLDRVHLLGWISKLGEPIVVGWLGLPAETSNAFLIGFLRRDYGAVYLLDAATGPQPLLNANQILVAMITITLFVPCIANVFVIAREHGSKVALTMVAFIFPFAFLVGGLVNHLSHWMGFQ